MVGQLLLGVVLALFALWMAGLLWANDFAVPTEPLRGTLRTMAVFPHADDETIAAGGTLGVLARAGGPVALVILTQGERGSASDRVRPELAEVRAAEAGQAVQLLGVSSLIWGGFADGSVGDHRDQVSAWLAGQIAAWRPDLLITYDLAGLYGHPDHVACAEIVTHLKSTQFLEVALWYSAMPRRLRRTMVRFRALPGDFPNASKRSEPTHKVFVGRCLFAKVRAWNTYTSQRDSLRAGAGKFVPPWLFLSVLLFEYFEAVAQPGRET